MPLTYMEILEMHCTSTSAGQFKMYSFTACVVTPYLYSISCFVLSNGLTLYFASQYDLGNIRQTVTWGVPKTPLLNLAYSHSAAKHSNTTQAICTGGHKSGRLLDFGTSDYIIFGYFILTQLYWEKELSVMLVTWDCKQTSAWYQDLCCRKGHLHISAFVHNSGNGMGVHLFYQGSLQFMELVTRTDWLTSCTSTGCGHLVSVAV